MKDGKFDIETSSHFELQLQTSIANQNGASSTLGLVASAAPPLLSLRAIEEKIEAGHLLFIQRGFGAQEAIPDIAYADVGAELFDAPHFLLKTAGIILKYEPFTPEEILLMGNNKVIISSLSQPNSTILTIQKLIEKKITAIAFNRLENLAKENLFDLLTQRSVPHQPYLESLSQYINNIVNTFLSPRNIKTTIQLNPEYVKAIYCFQGHCCLREIAQLAQVPYKSIVDLGWDWN